MKIWLMKGLGSVMKPADPASADALRKLAFGEAVECEFKRPRNARFHRLVMALLQLVFDNQESYGDFDEFRAAVTIEAGFYKDARLLDGTVRREALSISFAKMDEDEFSVYYGKIQNVIMTKLLPGISKPELDAEVEHFLGAWQ